MAPSLLSPTVFKPGRAGEIYEANNMPIHYTPGEEVADNVLKRKPAKPLPIVHLSQGTRIASKASKKGRKERKRLANQVLNRIQSKK